MRDPFQISKIDEDDRQKALRAGGALAGAAAVGGTMGLRGSGAGVRQVIRGGVNEVRAARKLAEATADVGAANRVVESVKAGGGMPTPKQLFVDIPNATSRAIRGQRKAGEAEARSKQAWEQMRQGTRKIKRGLPREAAGTVAGGAAGYGAVRGGERVKAELDARKKKAITKSNPFEVSKGTPQMGHRIAQIGSYSASGVARPGARGAVAERIASNKRRAALVDQYSTSAVPKALPQGRVNEARAVAKKKPSNFSWGRLAAYGGGGAAVGATAYGADKALTKSADPFEISKAASAKWAQRRRGANSRYTRLPE